jgi:segregation and condensation protein B
VAEEPLMPAQVAAALNQDPERIRELMQQLMAEFEKPEHGVSIKEVAGGYKMATKAEHHEAVRTFVKSLKAPLKLSLPALETLAVVAYKQPVTSPEIMDIRGVQGGGVLKTLLDRKLITEAGRKNVIGKPILYKTTKEFLIQFGLKDLSELPTLKEFEEIRRMSMAESETPEAEASVTAQSEMGPTAAEVPASETEAAETKAETETTEGESAATEAAAPEARATGPEGPALETEASTAAQSESGPLQAESPAPVAPAAGAAHSEMEPTAPEVPASETEAAETKVETENTESRQAEAAPEALAPNADAPHSETAAPESTAPEATAADAEAPAAAQSETEPPPEHKAAPAETSTADAETPEMAQSETEPRQAESPTPEASAPPAEAATPVEPQET